MIRLFFLILWTILVAINAYAACTGSSPTWTTTPDQASVQECLTNASRGDTVNILAGDVTWDSTVSFTKALSIIGAGKANTIIRSNISVPTGTQAFGYGTYQMLYYNPSSAADDANETIRVSGITFDANYKSSGVAFRNTSTTPLVKFRLDNCDFIDSWDGQYPVVSTSWTGVYIISVTGPIYGVIDNCRVYGYPKMNFSGLGNDSYNTAGLNYSQGNENSLYLEDNEFHGDGSTSHTTQASWWIDIGSGGWAAFRYNLFDSEKTYTNQSAPYSPHHATTAIYAGKGGEFYGNHVTYENITSPTARLRLFTTRGGKNLIYYNKQNSTGTALYSAFNYYTGTGYQPPPDTDTVCASDTLHSGDDVCAKDGQPQHTWRTGQWNNRVSTSGSGTLIYGYPDAGLVANRDYLNNSTVTACNTNGTCAGGIGCGYVTPTGSCTTGSMYWKSTQTGSCTSIPTGSYGPNPTEPISGILYRCSPTNIWSAYYTPYTYPHPLRGGADTTDPIISNVCAGAGSCVTPIIEIACAEEDETIDVIIGASTNENAMVKYDSSAGTDYTTGTWDGTMTGGGTAHTATLTGLACGASYTRYLKASDTSGNITDADTTLTFTIASKAGATPTVTNITGQYQAIAPLQSIDVTTDVPATCRLCVKDVSGCSSSTAWADRTQFTTTGGDTVHHSAQIAVTASSTSYIEVLCQDTQGNTSSNVEVTVTTDAKKTVTASGDQRVSVTGTKPVTVLP
jgi:hypothetical protein